MMLKYCESETITNSKILDIAKLYYNHKTENICIFMYEFSRADCVIFTAIHKKIFRFLKLKKYKYDEKIKMILHLNN